MSPADATRIGTAPILPPPPEERPRRVTAPPLWKVRHAHGTDASHLQTPGVGIVTARDARVPHGGYTRARAPGWSGSRAPVRVAEAPVRFAARGSGYPRAVSEFEGMVATMKKAAAALRDAGSVPSRRQHGCVERGGGSSDHDVDFLVKPDDADRAAAALEQASMRLDAAPEGWLLKAWDGDVLVDVIYSPSSGPVTDEVIERGEGGRFSRR